MAILMTGVTGFLGSALAANLLAEGTRVRALSRNDPRGQRVRAAVGKAAEGFGLSLGEEHWARLSTVEVDFQDLRGTLDPRVFEGVTDVWHSAAEMSFSFKSTLQSMEHNVVATAMLYALTARHARQCQRFYHVSTAYTVGFGNTEAREVIEPAPRLINPYQMTKWMAEVNLLQCHREWGLPLSLFRPSIVIGHRGTGWSTGGGSGMLSLADAALYACFSGAEELRLDMRGDAQGNCVCIDTVVRRARSLLKSGKHRQPTEIFHCVSDENLEIAKGGAPAWNLLNLKVAFGPPQSAVDADIQRRMVKYKPFFETTWNFHADNLKKVLGDDYGPQPLTPEITWRSMAYHLSQRLGVLSGGAEAAPEPLQQADVA